MPLETGTFIDSLVATNPLGSDAKSAGDDHLRLVKSTLKATFPNINGAVTPTQVELNYVVGVTGALQTQLNGKQASGSYQLSDATLTALAALSVTEGSLIYATGPDTFAVLPKGAASQVLAMNAGATAPNWVPNAASGVTSVSGTAPVVSSGGATPAISMPAATASVSGYMTDAQASKLNGIAAGANVGVSTNCGVDGMGQFCMCSLQVTSLAQGSAVAGSSLRYVKSNTTPAWVDGNAPTGTYHLLGPSLLIGEVGMFQRIA